MHGFRSLLTLGMLLGALACGGKGGGGGAGGSSGGAGGVNTGGITASTGADAGGAPTGGVTASASGGSAGASGGVSGGTSGGGAGGDSIPVVDASPNAGLDSGSSSELDGGAGEGSSACVPGPGAGFSIGGSVPRTGVLLGATLGGDIVEGFGTFAGAFTQNSANPGSEETITIDCGAVITSPGSQDYVQSPVIETFKGADGKSYTLSTSHQAILSFGPGTLVNAGVIAFATESLEDNAALFAYDRGPAGETPSPPNGNQAQYWGDAVFAHASEAASSAGIAITNGSASNSAAAVTSTVGGGATANVAGIFISSWNGDRAASFTLDNYGTISGTYNGSASATAAGWHAKIHNGGQNIQNRAGGSISASAPYYANAIYANTIFGNVRIVSDGSLTTTATGSLVGNTEGQGAAIGIDVSTYSGDISVTTGGALEVTSAGTAKSTAVGLSLRASTGTVAYKNSGYVKATAGGDSTTAKGLCAGNGGGPLVFENTGAIEADAPGGGWAAGLEQDSAHPIAITNQGTLSHKTGYGLFLFGPAGGTATVVNEASGTISGGTEAIAAESYAGDLTIRVYGSVSAGDPQQSAMNLGPGNDMVELNGSPTVIGTMHGGKGINSLILKLTGTLETVNGTAATQGNELSAYNLGSSGNITVSCRTYAWVDFEVSGTITK